jgi:hypothetical protein
MNISQFNADSEVTSASGAALRRHRWRFGLRTALLIILLASVPLAGAFYLEQAARERATEKEIETAWHEWAAAGPGGPDLWVVPAELDVELRNDTQTFVDVHRIELTEDVRRTLSRLRRVAWLRLCTETTAEDLRWIGGLTQLRGLSLEGAALQGADFTNLRELRSLQLLDLSSAEMAASDFATLPPLNALRAIHLQDGLVTDQYVTHLAELRLPSLTSVSLYHTRVSDEGLARLCAVYNLKRLDLHGCSGVTGRSVEAIGRMTHLRALDIGGTGLAPEYTATPDLQRLRELLPACAIHCDD